MPDSSLTLQQVVDFVAESVRDRHRRTRQPVNGATLAEAVRQRFPDIDYPALGVERLSGVVRKAEEQGLVIRNRNVRHLEVYPAGADVPPPAPAPARPADGPEAAAGTVRADLWRAFLLFDPSEARFFDKSTFQVVGVPPAAAPSFAESPRYLRVETVPTDVQRAWMRVFAADHSIADVAAPAIAADHCFTAFPAWLRGHWPELAPAWSTYRAQRVIEYAREWASANGIPADRVLRPRTPRPPEGRPGPAPAAATDHRESDDDGALRAAVLAAVADLPLGDLLNLAVPLRYVVRHFKAR